MAFNEVRRWHTMLWRLSAGLTWCRSCCKLDWRNKLQQTSKQQSTRTHPDTIWPKWPTTYVVEHVVLLCVTSCCCQTLCTTLRTKQPGIVCSSLASWSWSVNVASEEAAVASTSVHNAQIMLNLQVAFEKRSYSYLCVVLCVCCATPHCWYRRYAWHLTTRLSLSDDGKRPSHIWKCNSQKPSTSMHRLAALQAICAQPKKIDMKLQYPKPLLRWQSRQWGYQ